MKSLNISYRCLKSTVVLVGLLFLLISCNNKNEIETKSNIAAIEESVESREISDPDESNVHLVVEKMPHFPGGDEELMKFISTNVKYPAEAQESGIEGRVVCKFIVKKDGNIEDIVVVRGVHESLDNEAIRIIKSFPKWTPGEQNEKPVNVFYTIPITFRLQ